MLYPLWGDELNRREEDPLDYRNTYSIAAPLEE
jgi:hypothetical protein